MKRLFASPAVQGHLHARRTPLPHAACLWVESPKTDAQMAESVQESSSGFGCLHREHEQGPVGEIAITESLLQAFPPIRYFALDGRETDALLERQSCEFVGRFARFPCQPHEVGATEAFNGKPSSRHGGTDFRREIGPFKTAEKVAFVSLCCEGTREVPPGVLGSEFHEHRESHFGLNFHSWENLSEDTKVRSHFNLFQDMQRFFETVEIPQPVAVESEILSPAARESVSAEDPPIFYAATNDLLLPNKKLLEDRLKLYGRLLEKEAIK